MSKRLFDHVSVKLRAERPVKNTKQIAYKFLKEYLNDSSVHGIKYFRNLRMKSSILGKLFWILIMIISFVFLFWMIYKFWTRYNANPVRTAIESFQDPIWIISFPAITLCPLVPPLAARRRELRERFHLPQGMNNTVAMYLLKYGPSFSNHQVPGGKEHLNDLKILLKLNHMTLPDFLKFLRPCKDLMESCWWDGVKKNCSNLFKESHTSLGICCSFNYALEDSITMDRAENVTQRLRTASFGPTSGLTVVLHRDLLVETDDMGDIIRYATNSIGILVFPHHPLEYIGPIAPRHVLQAEQELRIIITPAVKKKIYGYYQRNYNDKWIPSCAHKGTKLKYFPVYRYSNCFISCSMEIALQFCGCLPIYYEPMAIKNSIKICDWEDIECLYTNAESIRVIQDTERENFTCKCYNRCTNIYYDTHTSSGYLNRESINISPIHKNLTPTQAILKVYMNSETFMVENTVPVSDELYLLASIGGIFSLFVGCSFISIIEIFYFIGLFIHAYCISKK